MLSKMDLRVQMDAKSGQLKIKVKAKFLVSGDAQESSSGTTINVFDIRFVVQFRVHLIIHLELNSEVHLNIYMKLHNKVHPRLY